MPQHCVCKFCMGTFLHVLLGFLTTKVRRKSKDSLLENKSFLGSNIERLCVRVTIHLTAQDDSLPTSLFLSHSSNRRLCSLLLLVLATHNALLLPERTLRSCFLLASVLAFSFSLALQISLLNRNIFAVSFMNCSIFCGQNLAGKQFRFIKGRSTKARFVCVCVYPCKLTHAHRSRVRFIWCLF